MHPTALESRPIWLEHGRPRFAKLERDADFDVAVIGGGVTGLTAAYLLKQLGKRVAVFEKSRIGGAETGHTTAQLTIVTDTRLSELHRTFGRETAQLMWLAGAAAINLIEGIVQREQIKCNFRRIVGYLHAGITNGHDEEKTLREEAEMAQSFGFDAHYEDSVPIFDKPGIRFANQALVHPIDYIAGLARAVHGDGCEVFEESEMSEAEEDPLKLKINGHDVHCQKLVIATHVPLLGLNNMVSGVVLQSKLAAYSTYVIGGTVPKGTLNDSSYWDTSNPYYYLRIDEREHDEYVIFGGEDHKTGQHSDAEEHYARLEPMLKQFLPQVQIDHRWSGQVLETNDGVPYIGPVNDHQFIATGYSGNGITFGTLAGYMARDWALGRENPWQELMRVDRTKLRGGTWHYLAENIDYPRYLLKGFLTPTEGDRVEDVPPGEGRILKLDGQRCAVYRSPAGAVSACSAICTHLGCVVRWNGAEKSWDCPCHGSRFTTSGEVMSGPAESPLEKHELG